MQCIGYIINYTIGILDESKKFIFVHLTFCTCMSFDHIINEKTSILEVLNYHQWGSKLGKFNEINQYITLHQL